MYISFSFSRFAWKPNEIFSFFLVDNMNEGLKWTYETIRDLRVELGQFFFRN